MAQRTVPRCPGRVPRPGGEFRLSGWAEYLLERYPGKLVAVVGNDPRSTYAFDTREEARMAMLARGVESERVMWIAIPAEGEDWPPARRIAGPARPWT